MPGPRARAHALVLALSVLMAQCAARDVAEPTSQPAPPTTGIPGSPPFDVRERSITDLQQALESRRTSADELVRRYLERVEAYDTRGPALTAMITLNPGALDEAAALDAERRERGARGPLHGIPIVIKDNFEVAGLPMTGGSLALEGFVPDRDAFMVAKLRAVGAIVLGKTNLHELAYGITSISSAGGQTRNPYDPTRNPGGSSGGTGAAVAASFAAAGMGSDTCGSIRIPAAHNNLYGLRGTAGLSSRRGMIPLSNTQDIGGPLARTVTDLAIMLDATVGPDPEDPMTLVGSARPSRTFMGAIGESSLRRIRIAALPSLFGSAPEDAEVTTVVRGALSRLSELGAEVFDREMSDLQALMQGTSLITFEFKFNLLDYLARHPGAPVHSLAEILASGRYHAAVEGVFRRAEAVAARDGDAYHQALERRRTLKAAVLAFMEANQLDALAYPTIRRKAAVAGQGQAGSNCSLSPATDLPALSMPAGFTPDGLPVGLELLGRPWRDAELLTIAYAYERLAQPRRAPPHTP
jgi:Asp-tRNA(Asn)/Glu-tRNA(Gln) amidotransferase A subunit family amidase